MMSSKPVPSSEDIRQKGNTFYKNGKVSEALLFYKRASELSPQETAPWSNLSAAYFELGDYTRAISACDTALALLGLTDSDNDAAKQKLSTRKVKSCFLAGLYEDADAEIDAAPSTHVEIETVSKGVQSCLNAAKHVEAPLKARHEVVLNLPRYKPTLIDTAEYLVIGHDTPESLFDASLDSSSRQRLSFLFGGIGDARNMFQTIIEIAAHEHDSKKKDVQKDYHFTIVDVKSPVIARNLIVLMLLDELSEMAHDAARAKTSKVLQCLFYTYLSAIMPISLHEVLQDKICEAKNALEKNTLPPFIEIPEMYRADIVGYLDDWQRKVQQEYPITRLRPEVVRTRQQYSGIVNVPPGETAAHQHRFEEQTGAFILAAPYNNLLDPSLREAFDTFGSRGSQPAVRRAVKAIENTWYTNPTLVDLAWEHSRHPAAQFDVGDNPCSFTEKIAKKMVESGFRPRYTMSQMSLFDFPAHWFISLAQGLKQMRGRVRIEACVGDVTAVLEQIKYGAVGHRKPRAKFEMNAQASQPEGTYPHVYDRIHLSNVPDYIGGTFTSYLYALQMTHPGQTYYVTSTCLRNPMRFNSTAEFDAEYVALYKEGDLNQIFQARIKPNFEAIMPMCTYHQWYHSKASREYRDLMPRANLQTWLYRLFFKIALPLERRIPDNNLVLSPLNLTCFFRLCTHLHSIGYPAHWLSEVISSLLTGTITTSARPPRSEPLSPREIDSTRKPMSQSVAPFTAEFSTHAAMWQLLLPFGMLSSEIAPVHTLRMYTLQFANVPQENPGYPVCILVFHKGTLSPSKTWNLRKALLSDEYGSKEYKAFREQEVTVLSTWTYHQETRTATFWLRGDEMQRMKEEGWKVFMSRTDTWNLQSSSYGVDKVEDPGVRWVDQVSGRV